MNFKQLTSAQLSSVVNEIEFLLLPIGGSMERRWRAPPPQGSRFFHVDIQNFRNVTASLVGAHTIRSWRPHPLSGNPGSATAFTWKSDLMNFIQIHENQQNACPPHCFWSMIEEVGDLYPAQQLRVKFGS